MLGYTLVKDSSLDHETKAVLSLRGRAMAIGYRLLEKDGGGESSGDASRPQEEIEEKNVAVAKRKTLDQVNPNQRDSHITLSGKNQIGQNVAE